MSKILHRKTAAPRKVVSAKGSWFTDADGRAYLDASGGAAVSCIGHNHPAVVEAIVRQAQAVEYAHTSFFTTDAAEQLAEALIARSPASFSHMYFVSDGSEAVETAIKLARQYHVERGEADRRVLISRRQSYHGNTLGALSLGGNKARRAIYEPLLVDVTHVSQCFSYRDRVTGEDDAAYADRLAAELEETIQRLGPKSVMAFFAETVVGATTGAVAPVEGYFRKVREICSRHGILLILDEVMCGTGRTGTFHAFEQERVVPDLITNAKGLGGGYQPIGAVYVSAAINDTISGGSGAFRHGHTYNGHAIACAAALAVQDVIRREALVERAAQQGARLSGLLRQAFANHPHVGDIRGRGLLQAIELVSDRAAKTPFDPALQLNVRIKDIAMDLGLCVYPGGGTADGVAGDHVLLAPPFNISDDDLALVVERLAQATNRALDACKASLSAAH